MSNSYRPASIESPLAPPGTVSNVQEKEGAGEIRMIKACRTDAQSQPNVTGVITGVLYFTARAAGVVRDSVSWISYGIYVHSEKVVAVNRRLQKNKKLYYILPVHTRIHGVHNYNIQHLTYTADGNPQKVEKMSCSHGCDIYSFTYQN